uniref:Uncharacterized protein n=1 Tax=Anguilla anguilla TaxID=7936 RepID=A0A0E9PQ73_ANGAN
MPTLSACILPKCITLVDIFEKEFQVFLFQC